MSKTLNFFMLAFFILLTATQIYAKDGAYVNEKYVEKLDDTIRDLSKQLSKTEDPKLRFQIITRMQTLYDAYDHPDVRMQIVKKRYPKYAAMIAKTNAMTDAEIEKSMKEDFLRRYAISKKATSKNAASSPWILLSEEERLKLCEKAFEECEKGEDIRFCHFVADRCRDYLDKEKWQKAEDMVKGKDRPDEDFIPYN